MQYSIGLCVILGLTLLSIASIASPTFGDNSYVVSNTVDRIYGETKDFKSFSIVNPEGIDTVRGKVGGNGLYIVLCDSLPKFNDVKKYLEEAFNRSPPFLVVISSDIPEVYRWILDKLGYYDVKVDVIWVSYDARYGAMIPVSTRWGDTVFYRPVAFNVTSSSPYRVYVYGRAHVMVGDTVKSFPVVVGIGKSYTIRVILVGSFIPFLTLSDYVDEELRYNKIRSYILDLARRAEVSNIFIVDALSIGIGLTRSRPVPQQYSPTIELPSQITIPSIDLSLFFFTLIFMVVLSLYYIANKEIYWSRLGVSVYKDIREVLVEPSREEGGLQLSSSSFDLFLSIITGLSSLEIAVIDAYHYIDSLIYQATEHNIPYIIKNRSALQMLSALTGVREDKLRSMLRYLQNLYMDVSEGYVIPSQNRFKVLNNLLDILASISPRLEGRIHG